MNPEELAMLEEQQMQQVQQDGNAPVPEEQPMPEMENPELAPEQMEMMGMGEQPFDPMSMMGQEEESPALPQATEVLNDVIMEFMDYVIGIKNDKQLDEAVRSKIMAEQASAISSLVPLLTNNGEMELMKARHEMDLKYQEHQMNMEMKQAELEFKKQEQQMNAEFKQQENQIKLQTAHQQSQQKIVQSQEQHESKMEQQKQAAQLKQSSNPSNKGDK